MAKTEGGIGLDEGIINFDHVSELIHFQLNSNNGVIRSQGGSTLNTNLQTNLVVDHHMNHLIQMLKQKELKDIINNQSHNDSNPN